MKTILSFTILFFICNLAFSQSLKVTYHTDYTLNAAKPQKNYPDRMVLHIEKNSSEFYSILDKKRTEMISLLSKKNIPYSEAKKELDKIPRSFINFKIYKNYPQKGILTYTNSVVLDNYKYTETIEKPQWTLLKGHKKIIDCQCQKATTHFKGRDWTVWYTTEIPVQDGPWKLWGLPGLILEAQDRDSLYHFSAIGLKEIESKPISLNKKKKYINCTRKEYIQQEEEYHKNPAQYIKTQTNSNITISRTSKNGKTKKFSSIKYIDIEIDEK